MPPALLPPTNKRRTGRNGLGWDVAVAVALGVALLAGGWLDVSAYFSGSGKHQPAFRLLDASDGQRITYNEFFQETSTVVRLGNFGRLEFDDPQHRRLKFRWMFGPVSTVEIWSERTEGRIDFFLHNRYPDQTMTVAYNGRTLEEIHLEEDEEISRQYPLEIHPGSNQFTVSFTRFNPPGPGERPIAARLRFFDLYLPAADGKY